MNELPTRGVGHDAFGASNDDSHVNGATSGPTFALPEAMNRWEYKRLRFTTLEFNDVGEARLNASGAEGWEVVAVVTGERHGYSHDVTFVLKRPLRYDAPG